MTDKNLKERRKYVTAFNSTMVKIWREQISLLGVIDTGAFYRSTMAVRMTANDKVAILGFGTFAVQEKGARTGINPRTQEKIEIPARKAIKFKAGADLDAKVK